MKITIEIDAPYLDTIRKWASVSRTLNAAKAICDDPADEEQRNWTYKELSTLEPALGFLHKQAQEAIWAEDAKFNHVRMMTRLSKIQQDFYSDLTIVKVDGYAEDGNVVTLSNGRVDTWTDGETLHDTISPKAPDDPRQNRIHTSI